MKLSIFFPSHNMGKFIGVTLYALLICVLKNDAIVVNDAGKDNTLKVIKEWEYKYLELIRVINKEDGAI